MVASPHRLAACALVALFAAAPGVGAAEPAAPPAATEGPVTHLPLPRYVSLRAESANARRGPSMDQRVDWEFVRRGMPLQITAEYGNWRRVRDADGAGGWVHQTMLSGTRTALVLGTEPVEIRADPDPGTPIRARVEPGVVARLNACAGAWCEITVDGERGWLSRSAIWGAGPEETFD
ncbi:MAG: SH3 domain-containing protein [Amaricoccus sp.]